MSDDKIDRLMAPYMVLMPALRGDPMKQLAGGIKDSIREGAFQQRLDDARQTAKDAGIQYGVDSGIKFGFDYAWDRAAEEYENYGYNRGFLEGQKFVFTNDDIVAGDVKHLKPDKILVASGWNSGQTQMSSILQGKTGPENFEFRNMSEYAWQGVPVPDSFGTTSHVGNPVKTRDVGFILGGDTFVLDRRVIKTEALKEEGKREGVWGKVITYGPEPPLKTGYKHSKIEAKKMKVPEIYDTLEGKIKIPEPPPKEEVLKELRPKAYTALTYEQPTREKSSQVEELESPVKPKVPLTGRRPPRKSTPVPTPVLSPVLTPVPSPPEEKGRTRTKSTPAKKEKTPSPPTEKITKQKDKPKKK
jgi:hypothetical protein